MPVAPDEAMIAEAVAAAEAADVVVAVVGDRIELVGEGRSTATLELVGGQVALLDALAGTGTPLVVVVIASKPLVLPPSAMNAAAIIWAANPGMLGGQAIAELVLGRIEPSGRLPISFAEHVGQLPVFYNQLPGQHGTRYADLTQRVPFAFGEGLSYTTVEYADLRVLEPVLGASRHRPRAGRAAQHGGPAVARDRAGLRAGHGHVGDLGDQGAQDVPAGGRRAGRAGGRRPRAARSRTARWSTRAGAGSSSPASSSCWSARRRATRLCCARGSWSRGARPMKPAAGSAARPAARGRVLGAGRRCAGRLVAIDDTGLADVPLEDRWIVALPGPGGIERLWPDLDERVPDDQLRYFHEPLDPDAVTAAGGIVAPVGDGGRFTLDVPAGPTLLCRLVDAEVQGCAAVELLDGHGVHATVGEGGFFVTIPVESPARRHR